MRSIKACLKAAVFLGLVLAMNAVPVFTAQAAVPAAPAGLTGQAVNGAITLSWTDNSDNETEFIVYRKELPLGAEFLWNASKPANCTKHGDVNVEEGQMYAYMVCAHNEDGDSAPSNIVMVTAESQNLLPPSAPTDLTAQATGDGKIELQWNHDGIELDGFGIYRQDGENDVMSYWRSADAGQRSYIDDSVESGITYYYQVTAANFFGQSIFSNTASATPQMLTFATPSAPSDLSAAATEAGNIALQWTDNSSETNGFEIYRQEGSNGAMGFFAEVGSGITSYVDDTADTGVIYYYQVRSMSQYGYSGFSNVASAEVAGSNQPQPNGTTVLQYYIGSLQYLVNGQPASLDAAPAVIENRLLLPIRFVVEPLGGIPLWNDDTRQATIDCKGHLIILQADSNIASLDGASIQIDPGNAAVTPLSINDRIFVPLRFVGESLDCAVQWNQLPQEAVLTWPDPNQ